MVISFANRKQTVKIGLVHMTVGALSIISFAASAGGVFTWRNAHCLPLDCATGFTARQKL